MYITCGKIFGFGGSQDPGRLRVRVRVRERERDSEGVFNCL